MRTGRRPVIIFTVALLVRVLFLVSAPPPVPTGDALDYDPLALRLLEGKGYADSYGRPTSMRPPGYTLFLAGVYRVFGRNTRAVGVVQGVLDAATCMMVYVLARRMFDEYLALVSAGFSALSLGQIAATRLVMSESLTVFFVVLAALLVHVGLAGPSRVALGGAGVALGLGVLTKGTIVLLPFLLGWVIWRASRGEPRVALRRWAIVLFFFGLTLLPWVIRNYIVHHRLVLVATQMGYVLYSSYNPPHGKIFGMYTHDETVERIMATLPEADMSKALLAETVRYVRAHPDVVPKLTLLKIVYFFSPIDWELVPEAGGAGVVNFTFVFAAPFAAYGLWLARRGDWQVGLLATMLGGFFLTAVLTYGSPRLRLPVEPLLAIFSGLGLVGTVRRLAGHRAAVLSGIGAYLVAAFASYVFSDQVRFAGRLLLASVGLW